MENLFKAKTVEHGKWVCGDYRRFRTQFGDKSINHIIDFDEEYRDGLYTTSEIVIPETVSRYIGPDREGNSVFENDRVEGPNEIYTQWHGNPVIKIGEYTDKTLKDMEVEEGCIKPAELYGLYLQLKDGSQIGISLGQLKRYFKVIGSIHDELKSGFTEVDYVDPEWGCEVIMEIYDYADLGGKRSWDFTEKGISPKDEGIKPLLITNKPIEMGDLIIINNVAYCICSMSGKGNKRLYAYVERLKEQNVFINGEEPKERNYTGEITCPYCGKEFESWEMDDEEEEYECNFCGSTFSYQRNVTVEYCTQPVKKGEAVILS